jgi:hypothetical protein
LHKPVPSLIFVIPPQAAMYLIIPPVIGYNIMLATGYYEETHRAAWIEKNPQLMAQLEARAKEEKQ